MTEQTFRNLPYKGIAAAIASLARVGKRAPCYTLMGKIAVSYVSAPFRPD